MDNKGGTTSNDTGKQDDKKTVDTPLPPTQTQSSESTTQNDPQPTQTEHQDLTQAGLCQELFYQRYEALKKEIDSQFTNRDKFIEVLKNYIKDKPDFPLPLTQKQVEIIKRFFEELGDESTKILLIKHIVGIDPTSEEALEKYNNMLNNLDNALNKPKDVSENEIKEIHKKTGRFDDIELDLLSKYSVQNEKPNILLQISKEQLLQSKFNEFRVDPNAYFANRNLKIRELQGQCAKRFNELLNQYMNNNIPYSKAKNFAEQLVEVMYKSGIEYINESWPVDFSSLKGYKVIKDFSKSKQ